MLGGRFNCGIFIGGMEGVEEEYQMFKGVQKSAPAFPVASTGAAAAILFNADATVKKQHPELENELSYISLMRALVNYPSREGPNVQKRRRMKL
jgi:hypothetical protein